MKKHFFFPVACLNLPTTDVDTFSCPIPITTINLFATGVLVTVVVDVH